MAAQFPQNGMLPSLIHHHIPLSLFLSSCGLPPNSIFEFCQKPFYLLFFPASCKISSFFRFIGFISCGNYLDKKKRFYVHWGILLEGCILEMKKFMNCLKMKKEPLNNPFPPATIFQFYRILSRKTPNYHGNSYTNTKTPGSFRVCIISPVFEQHFPSN